MAFAPISYRRSAWLIVIGRLHACFIGFGDILFHYALMGMIVFLFRKATPRTLITIACMVLPMTLLINYGSSSYEEELHAARLRRRADRPAIARKSLLVRAFSLWPGRVAVALADLRSKAADAPLDVYTLALDCLAVTAFE